jgi:hypothetical protein
MMKGGARNVATVLMNELMFWERYMARMPGSSPEAPRYRIRFMSDISVESMASISWVEPF